MIPCPGPFHKPINHKLRFLVSNHPFCCQKTPPKEPTIQKLFPGPEEEIRQNIEYWWSKYKTKAARIRNIAKKYNITKHAAKKYLKAAKARLAAELNYRDYIENKDYYEYMESNEGRAEMRAWIEALDAERKRQMDEFHARIDAGKEHVIRVKAYDAELKKLLDVPAWANMDCQLPMSYAVSGRIGTTGHIRLTEHDARILYKKGLLTVALGDPDTLFNYEFLPPPEPVQEPERIFCSECGRILDFNDVGLNKKLGAKCEADYKCPRCLGMDEEYEESVVTYYRSTGCNMFI